MQSLWFIFIFLVQIFNLFFFPFENGVRLHFWLKIIILYSLCISPLREIRKPLTDSCALSPYRSLTSFSTSLWFYLHMQINLTNTPHSNPRLKKETLLSVPKMWQGYKTTESKSESSRFAFVLSDCKYITFKCVSSYNGHTVWGGKRYRQSPELSCTHFHPKEKNDEH